MMRDEVKCNDWCFAIPRGVRLVLHIMPNAKKSQIIGPLGNVLKVRLQALPIEGKANEALIRYLAETLGISRREISITHGHTSKRKIVEVYASQVSVDSVKGMLLAAVIE